MIGASAVGLSMNVGHVAGDTRTPRGGESATWTTGEQYGFGTLCDHHTDDPSRVWFTLSAGALASVRFPRIDVMNLRTFDFLVADAADGSTYAKRTGRRSRRGESTIERTTRMVRDDALIYRQTVRETGDGGHQWRLDAEYAVHPDHEAVLVDVRFTAQDGGRYDVYAVADPAVSNSGMGDVASTADGALRVHDTNDNDDEAVFRDEDGAPYNNAMAVVARGGFEWTTVDVGGGDSLSPLFADGDDGTRYTHAKGNVVLVGRLGDTEGRSGSPRGSHHLQETVALGFATDGDENQAHRTAQQSLQRPFESVRERYARTWRDYLARVSTPASVTDDALSKQYNACVMVLKAAESKQYPGAGIASPSVPWGDGVRADEPSDYGYNFTWARDLYQAFTALDAVGDVESAVDATEYIYSHQQDDDGFIPQNTYIDGRTRWGGEQLDNISFPQVMAYQLRERHGIGFETVGYRYENVRRSADYVVANGPSTGQERWEEEAGYSPSTIAAEIAGLVCAASIAAEEDERADALLYLGVADSFQRSVEEWTATTEGTDRHTSTPYYVRVNDDRDPDDGASRSLANGGPTLDERNVIDAGFLELVRLGVKPWDDPVVRNSLDVVDETIRVDTPNGPCWYRYNGDGYGEQSEDGAHEAGAPWSLDNTGRGRLWPIFTGERGEYELLAGTDDGPLAPPALLRTMSRFANSGRMIPEQVWDRPDPTAYGWTFGSGTGGATPLSWSMAQFVRLAHSIDDGRPIETPAAVRDRYADGAVPDEPRLDIESVPDVVETDTVSVDGTTDGTEIVVKTDAETVYRSVEADGSFSIEVAVGDGESGVTVVAGTNTNEGNDMDITDVGTSVVRQTVVRMDVGEKLYGWAEPSGDDHGPGSYVYPTDSAYVDGAFDITAFDVYETETTYQFVFGLGALTNPWGGTPISLQTIQVYVRGPSASGGAADAREGVNATFEAPYHYRLVVEGFTESTVEAADGTVVSRDVSATSYPSADSLKIEVPKTAFETELREAEIVPLVLGQDGFSPGRIRPVTEAAGAHTFGGGRDDDLNPNVIDLVTPDGQTQSDALAYSTTEAATIPYLSLDPDP